MVRPKTPPPKYSSWSEFLGNMRNEPSEAKKMCESRTNKANSERLMSPAPARRITAKDVWSILVKAQGRCIHCGSLAVERRPSKSNGAPIRWEHIGRRIGSLEHLKARVDGGGNEPENLAWACLWCNTWKSERRPGATDHGGHYPAEGKRRGRHPLPPWPIHERPCPLGNADIDDELAAGDTAPGLLWALDPDAAEEYSASHGGMIESSSD